MMLTSSKMFRNVLRTPARCWLSTHSAARMSSSATQMPGTEPSAAQEPNPGPPKLVVFGGRGFVGSHIVQEAVSAGLHVVGLSRAGTPPMRHAPWVDQVEWARGDALEPRTYEHHLQGATAVISAVGAFGSQEQMLKLNGTANVTAIRAAKAAGVPRFVYISANIPNVPGIETLLRGYVQGKRMSEEALAQEYPEGGVALRPGVIYGNRAVSPTVTLPLQYAFQPLEFLLDKSGADTRKLSALPLLGAAFVPPVDVRTVARAAVAAATDPSVPSGIMDVWQLRQYK